MSDHLKSLSQNPTTRLALRHQYLKAIREYFWNTDFVEVATPIAQSTLAPEPHIDALNFTVEAGYTKGKRFLQTSPELLMKRILAAGLPRIFQIASCFRDQDLGPHHHPEFLMLEWYRHPGRFEMLFDDLSNLIRHSAQKIRASERIDYQGQKIDLQPPFLRMSVDEAFLKYAGFSILDSEDAELLRGRALDLGLQASAHEPWDDLFFRIFLNCVEPQLATFEQPIFLYHYPIQLAALARPSPQDPRVAERLELYIAGIELANGFGELTDTHVQRKRFQADEATRLAQHKEPYGDFEPFLRSLDQLSLACGMAFGLDRWLMILLNQKNLDAVVPLPWSAT